MVWVCVVGMKLGAGWSLGSAILAVGMHMNGV